MIETFLIGIPFFVLGVVVGVVLCWVGILMWFGFWNALAR